MKGSIYLTAAASIWGGMYVVSKVVLTVISPMELLWLRYVVALAALGIMGFMTKQSWHIERQHMPLIFSIGFIGYFLSIWAQFVGTQLSSAQMGAVITSATPTFMAVFGYLLLKERIDSKKVISVSLATVGVLLIVGVGEIGDSFQLGGIILFGAALTWALMSVLIKKVPCQYSQLVVTTYGILIAAVLMTPFVITSLTITDHKVLSDPAIWGGILYIGIISTAGAFYLWNKGLQLMEASRGGLYFFFQPVMGTILGWLFLGEEPDLFFWIGAALIGSGIFLVVNEKEAKDP